MKQAFTPPNTLPPDLSPEFLSWLVEEKSTAKRYQLRLLKVMMALILAGCALFLLKGQPDWVQQIVQVVR